MSKVVASYLVKVVLREESEGDIAAPTNKQIEASVAAAISEDLDDLAPEYISVSSERTDQ